MPNSASNTTRLQAGILLVPLVFCLVAIVIYFIPLQHYLSLGRYQHYGLAIFIWGWGYIVQAIWAWKLCGNWSRGSYILAGLYLTSLGITLYANPWLEPRVALQTDVQMVWRFYISLFFILLSIPTTIVWLMGLAEELHENGKRHKLK
jgi:hypothetical protein